MTGKSEPEYQQTPGAINEDAANTIDGEASSEVRSGESRSRAKSLEGIVLQRRARIKGSYRRRYLVLNLTDGGSLTCYRAVPSLFGRGSSTTTTSTAEKTPKKKILNSIAAKGRAISKARSKKNREEDPTGWSDDWDGTADSTKETLSGRHYTSLIREIFEPLLQVGDKVRWSIPASVPWMIRDVENDEKMFQIVVRCPSGRERESIVVSKGPEDMTEDDDSFDGETLTLADSQDEDMQDEPPQKKKKKKFKCHSATSETIFHFRVQVNGNEKYLWLMAAAMLNRQAPTLFTCNCPIERALRKIVSSRVRTPLLYQFFEQGRQLEFSTVPQVIEIKSYDHEGEHTPTVAKDIQMQKLQLDDTKEHKVHPTYAYRHRYMTDRELHSEMILPSARVHDLCPVSEQNRRIGTLQVEVLACFGLPRFDLISYVNPVCYLVCGSYAFATDAIHGKRAARWPCRARRAACFPLSHAYAKLFVGVFHDAGPNDRDGFVGRVVVDLARLRPGCTYDVTLPLRLYQNSYVRTKRGAVRLRFRVDFLSERAAVLSYLDRPMVQKKRKGMHTPPSATIVCADTKSFRNVSLTVQGAHLPGRFTQKIMRGTTREIKLYKIALKALVKQHLHQISTWTHPLVSLCIFSAWMHCVYSNSVALVPPYVICFMGMVLLRNYTKYNINNLAHRGFCPLTIEEMLLALLLDKPESMKPLEISGDVAFPQFFTSSDEDDELSVTNTTVTAKEPQSLRSVTDNDWEESTEGEALNHMEFPFSDKDRYPKITVQQSLAASKRQPLRRMINEATASKGLSRADSQTVSSQADEDEEDEDEDLALSFREELPMIDDMGQPEQTSQRSVDAETTGDNTTKDAGSTTVSLLPEQNLDIRVKSKKKLKDELRDTKEKMQDLTLRLFDDRVYFKDDDDNCSKELDKILRIHSHSNPMLAKADEYFSPFLEMLKIGLCGFRSLFNVFMWKDPYLSFWALLACVFLALVLSVFPWRGFMLAVGLIFVGPQNWAFRILCDVCQHTKNAFFPANEKKSGDESVEVGDSSSKRKKPFPRLRHKLKAQRKVKPETDDVSRSFIFYNHLVTGNGQTTESEEQKMDGLSKQEVVIPYSPLLHTRFYDWPPEKSYATVMVDKKEA